MTSCEVRSTFWPVCRQLTFISLFVLGMRLPGWTQQKAATPNAPIVRHGRTPEDWSSPSLAGSELIADPPLVATKDDHPTFTRELLQVKWRTGDPIDLYVMRPKGVAKPPVILYLYSYPSETDRFRDDNYCTRITDGGYAAVGFVSALTGHRYKMRPMKEWFVSELPESLSSSAHDVQMILNYLATRGDLDMDRVGMFGTGSGATIAILSAAVDARIKAIDLLDPWGDWPDWMAKSSVIPEEERPNFVKPEFLKKVAPLDPVEWLPKVKSQGIRIQRLKDDTATPQIAEEKIEAAAGANAKLMHYENVQQFYGASSGGRVFQWVKSQLNPHPEGKSPTQTANTGKMLPQSGGSGRTE